MKAIASAIASLVLAVVCAVGGWIACELWPKPKATGPAMRPQTASTTACDTVKEMEYNRPESFIAHAEAESEVDLLPQVDGYVKSINFKEGDIVKAGQLLYELDDERYQAVVNQRKADLAAAEAELRRAQRQMDRMNKADPRGITQLERDNVEASVEKAEASVLQMKANLIVAEYDCKKAKVFAPITGQIGKSSAHIGDYVAPSKGALAHIVQVDPIRVSFPLPDRQYIAFREAEKEAKKEGRVFDQYRFTLVLPDGTPYDQQGYFAFDDNTMSKETATIMLRIEFPNPDRMLIPNSYVTMQCDSFHPVKYPTVQQSAVFDTPAGERAVWVVQSDGTVKSQVVQVLPTLNGFVACTSGVKAGDKVVISGVGKLHEGEKITEEGITPTANEENDPNYKGFKL